jgi:hypothetical protein
MAELQKSGAIVAFCPGCNGGKSTFEWHGIKDQFGAIEFGGDGGWMVSYRLFRCAACGKGAFGVVKFSPNTGYPGSVRQLITFYPESSGALPLPRVVPTGIVKEFREGENCLANDCIRAAAGMFRSVLDKTLRANGYKTLRENLAQQIDAAAEDKVITESRRLRAHEEIRVLGNDVLHDEWHVIPKADVESARHYCQRILEDFYDDRKSVLALLRAAGRTPEEDKPQPIVVEAKE